MSAIHPLGQGFDPWKQTNPAEFALTGEHPADVDERDRPEIWESEQKALRALELDELRFSSLHAQIAARDAHIRELERVILHHGLKLPKHPEPSDVGW